MFAQRVVEFACRRKITAERLLDDDPARLGHPDARHPFHDVVEQEGRYRQERNRHLAPSVSSATSVQVDSRCSRPRCSEGGCTDSSIAAGSGVSTRS